MLNYAYLHSIYISCLYIQVAAIIVNRNSRKKCCTTYKVERITHASSLRPLSFYNFFCYNGGGSSEGNTSRAMINNIAKPGCEKQCGNVIVPYPFGIGNNTGCSLDDSFYVTCDLTYKPPKLFLGDGYEIFNISDSELRVKTLVTYLCYDQYGERDDAMWAIFSLSSFTFSEKNKLTVIGCDDYGLITGRDGKDSSGNIGLCSKPLDIPDSECSRKGCCQTSITKGRKYYEVTLKTFRNHTDVWSFNRCSYSFLSGEGLFKFGGVRDLSNASEVMKRLQSTIPIVVSL